MAFLSNDLGLIYLLAQSNQGSGLGDLINLIIGLAAYIFGSYCFQMIYQKLGEPNA